MFRILVCFKIVPDLDAVSNDDWKKTTNSEIDLSYARKILGVYDESALESALRLKDEFIIQGMEVELTAFTIGTGEMQFQLKSLFSVQFDRVVKLAFSEDIRFCPKTIARIISSFVSKEDRFDAVIFGQQASIGDNGQTHYYTAESLKMPCLSNVSELSLVSNGIRSSQISDSGIIKQTTCIPSVYAIGNAVHAYLRVPTLREKIAASNKIVEVLTLADIGLEQEGLSAKQPELIKLFRENKEKHCQMIAEGSTAEKAECLLLQYLKEVIHS